MLAFDLRGHDDLSQTISGSGGLTQMGPGLLTLTGSNTYTGTTTISGGTLQIGNGSSGSISSTNNVTDNGLLAFDLAASTTTFRRPSAAAADWRKWPPLCILTGNNTYSGSTTIASGGTLQIGNGGANGSIGSSSRHRSTTDCWSSMSQR